MDQSKLTITERMLMKSKFIDDTKKKTVMEVFSKMVILANQEINLSEFKKTYFPTEDRTLEFIIDGMEDLDTGFVIQENKVRTMKKLQDKPTATFRCSEDTFLRLGTGEITFAQAYFYGWLSISGEKAIRDYEIFKRMFNKYRYIFDKINGK